MNNIQLLPMLPCRENEHRLQAVLDEAPNYSFATTGKAPATAAGHTLLAALPPGKTAEDKFVFGVSRSGELVGCVDVVRGYPTNNTAFIGLLLICEGYQGLGYGGAAYQLLEGLIAGWGSTKVRLAVVQSNPQAVGFWARMGFEETGERLPYCDGVVKSWLFPMEKLLCG